MNDEIILEYPGSVETYNSEYDEYSENEYNIRTDQASYEGNSQTIEEDPVPVEEDSEEVEIDETVLILNDIKEELGDIKDDLRDSQEDRMVDRSVRSDPVVLSDNAIVSVNSIIYTPINEYSISESILTLIFVGLFVAGMALVIKRSLFKWK